MKKVGAEAAAYEIDGSFVVLKGSTARRVGAQSWEGYVGLRDTLVRDGKLVPKTDELFTFAQDVEFSSPSAAAAVIAAANRNGRITWRVSGTSQTYADWKESQLRVNAGHRSKRGWMIRPKAAIAHADCFLLHHHDGEVSPQALPRRRCEAIFPCSPCGQCFVLQG